MGGFKNDRTVFAWCGQTIELDETKYEWGTVYEIELETVRFLSPMRHLVGGLLLAPLHWVLIVLYRIQTGMADMLLGWFCVTNRTSQRRFSRSWRIS